MTQREIYGKTISLIADTVSVQGAETHSGAATFNDAVQVNNALTVQGPIFANGFVSASSQVDFYGPVNMHTAALTLPSLDGSPAPLVISDSAAEVSKIVSITAPYANPNSVLARFFRLNQMVQFVILSLDGAGHIVTAAGPSIIIPGVFDPFYRPIISTSGGVCRVSITGVEEFCEVGVQTNGDLYITRLAPLAFVAGTTVVFNNALSGVMFAAAPA
jgi:hypothetical protein